MRSFNLQAVRSPLLHSFTWNWAGVIDPISNPYTTHDSDYGFNRSYAPLGGYMWTQRAN